MARKTHSVGDADLARLVSAAEVGLLSILTEGVREEDAREWARLANVIAGTYDLLDMPGPASEMRQLSGLLASLIGVDVCERSVTGAKRRSRGKWA